MGFYKTFRLDEFTINMPLTKGQKLMLAAELLNGGVFDLVLKFRREHGSEVKSLI